MVRGAAIVFRISTASENATIDNKNCDTQMALWNKFIMDKVMSLWTVVDLNSWELSPLDPRATFNNLIANGTLHVSDSASKAKKLLPKSQRWSEHSSQTQFEAILTKKLRSLPYHLSSKLKASLSDKSPSLHRTQDM